MKITPPGSITGRQSWPFRRGEAKDLPRFRELLHPDAAHFTHGTISRCP